MIKVNSCLKKPMASDYEAEDIAHEVREAKAAIRRDGGRPLRGYSIRVYEHRAATLTIRYNTVDGDQDFYSVAL